MICEPRREYPSTSCLGGRDGHLCTCTYMYMEAGLHVGETRSRYRRFNPGYRDIYSKLHERIIFEPNDVSSSRGILLRDHRMAKTYVAELIIYIR